MNPNAHCPVCGAIVFFYRSPFDGRVFFDSLGWPWPKHPCTDNFGEPRAVSRDEHLSQPRVGSPTWKLAGWSPLLSSKVSSPRGRPLISGDFQGQFVDLYLLGHESIDPDSPILVRKQPGNPDVFELTFLRSDRAGTRACKMIAFRVRLAPLGDKLIGRLVDNDLAATNEIGQFILWRLEDPVGAKPYIERAIAGGIADAIFDLAIIGLFRDRVRSH